MFSPRADEDRESNFGKVYSVSGPVVIAENMVRSDKTVLHDTWWSL